MKFHTIIASDVDGTLIPEETTELPPVLWELVSKAYEKGYLILAASGRQYPSLRALFAPVADKMAFAAENGGGLYYQDKLMYAGAMDRDLAISIAQYVQQFPNCEFLVGAGTESCIIPKTQRYIDHLVQVQKLKMRQLSDYSQFPELVMKISVWCTDGSARYEQPFRERWGDRAKVALSGEKWIDFNCSDKGDCFQAACGVFGVSRENTVAFGDNWNDVPMLDFAARPYIMASARPELRARYANICGSVPEELKKILADSERM